MQAPTEAPDRTCPRPSLADRGGGAVDLSPAAVIVALLVGGSLAGFVGALLSLPVAAVIKVEARELYVSDWIEEVRKEDAVQAAARAGHWRPPWRNPSPQMPASERSDAPEP